MNSRDQQIQEAHREAEQRIKTRLALIDHVIKNNPDFLTFNTDTILEALAYYTYCQNLELEGIVQWVEMFSPTEFKNNVD